MDAEFERRWRNGHPPFDGLTVTLHEYVSLPLLQHTLVIAVERLFAYHPDTHLYRLLDWHEHDGYITESTPCDWQELRSLVAAQENLEARFRLGDTYVSEGFFPTERDYYLRFYVHDADGNPFCQSDDSNLVPCGTLDITGPESLITPIAAAIQIRVGSNVKVMSAKAFFDRSYGGGKVAVGK